MSEFAPMAQVRRCRLRPPTVCFYFNCRHPAALPRTAAGGQELTLPDVATFQMKP
jgi:hypothetical protein